MREARGMTQKDLSSASGVSQTHISHLENNVKSYTQKTLEPILKALGATINDLFITVDIVKLKEIPLFNGGAGEPSHFTDEGYPVGFSSETITVPTNGIDDNSFGVKIHGESMYPTLNIGDIVVVVPSAPLANNRLCFATWPAEDGKRTVKRFYKYGDVIVLRSDNPDKAKYPDIELSENNHNGVRIYRVTKSIREE